MAAAMGAERQGALPASGIGHFDRQPHHRRRARRSSPSPATAATATSLSRRRSRPRRGLRWLPPTAAREFAAGRAAIGRARRAGGVARARRRGAGAHQRQGDRRDRLGRQDRNQGGVAARAVQGRRDPRVGRLLQQSLGRAAVARALSGERALRGAGNGNESRRRDRAAVAAGSPACRDHHRRSRRCIWNSSARSPRSPTPRPRSFSGSSRAAPRSSTATIRNSRQLKRRAKEAGVTRIVSFGEHAKADARLIKCALHAAMLDRAGGNSRHRT